MSAVFYQIAESVQMIFNLSGNLMYFIKRCLSVGLSLCLWLTSCFFFLTVELVLEIVHLRLLYLSS